MSSNFILIPSIAFCCYIFLLLAFIAAKKTPEVKAFILALICCLLWTGGSTLMRLQMWPGYHVWYNASLMGLFLLAWAMYYFILVFTNREPNAVSLIWLILVIAMTLFNSVTGSILHAPEAVTAASGDVSFVYTFNWHVILFFVVCGGIILNTFYNIATAWKKNEILKQQLKPIIAGIGFIFLAQLLLLLPAVEGFPVDVLSALIMVGCFFYALYKRRLIRLTLLISKGACYAASAILAVLLFSNCINPMQEFIDSNLHSLAKYETLIIALFFTLFTVFLYSIMKVFLDTVFIKDEFVRANTIKKFSEDVSGTLRIDEILEKVISVIMDTVMTGKIHIFIENDAGTSYQIARSSSPLDDRSFSLKKDNPLIRYFSEYSDSLLYDDFRRLSSYRSMWEAEKEHLDRMDIQCLVPLHDNDELIGIIAVSGRGPKSRITYGDMDMLSSIGSVASIAVKNSRLYEKAYLEARTDELTGLLNRKYFYETLEKECRHLKKSSLSLIIINVDDFKLYNQLYGATEGDHILKKIAAIIAASVGENGYTARYGNKEFGIILPGYDVLSAKNLSYTISRQIMNMNKADSDYALKVLTVSCGISSIPYDASSDKELLQNADMAVFQVKRNGKNGVMVYSGHQEKYESPDDLSGHRQDVYSEYAPTIYALTAAIDTKDHYTFDHSNNVAYYACELGYAFGLNDDSVEILREAALLHDIGKIGIPEHILNKPGLLTDKEFETMKTHVQNSIGIIRHLPSLDYVIPAVIGHHENYDGTGYPRRIAGEDIPLHARILCVADSFDAMVSSRAYKDPYSVDYALEQLSTYSGTQFDPALAQLFIRLVKEGQIQPKSTDDAQ